MANSYQTNILILLKSLCHGNILQTLPCQILFLFSLTVGLACDPSVLPKGAQISQSGPVLKLICDPGLQALEMVHSIPSVHLLLPSISKRKFARYVCLGGTSYQRINAQGIESSIFLCADSQVNLCDSLEHSADLGHLHVKETAASWQPAGGGQRSVLYCAHGVWYRLGGGPLPHGVTAKQRHKPSEQALTTASGNPSLLSQTTTSTTTTIISPVTPMTGPPHVPYSLLPPPSPSRTKVEHKPPSPSAEGLLPHPDSVEELLIPTSNIIIFAGSASHALNTQLHWFTQITFYCMLAIGFVAMISGLILLMFMCRKGTRLAADGVKAQKRLKNMISIV